jgi:surface antigen
MDNTMTKLTLIALIFSLTACSTNTQEQNTAVGAGTGAVVGGLVGSLARGAGSGWVIAAGAVVGAVIGGILGHSMDSTDNANINTALDKNSINEPANWTNDKTGVWYKIIPTSDVMVYHGNVYCRHYVAYGHYKGKMVETKGIACRNEAGMWQQVK